MNMRFLINLIFLFFPFLIFFPQEGKFNDYYNKAELATFYSSEYLNGFYELELAFAYLDSAESSLNAIGDSTLFSMCNQKLLTLKNELSVSKDISVDNLNYIYPHYSLIAGYRNDFNLIDNAEELLIEEVLLKQLNQADPFYKGNLIDNTHFILFNIDPFDDGLLGVCIDFLASETNHYAIRSHEVLSILGSNGFDRYKNNQLNNSDWQQILNHYNIDKVYNFSIADKGSLISNLYYKGVTLNVIKKEDSNPKAVKYVEGFKMDKSDSFISSICILILSYLIFFLIVTVAFEDSYKKIK